MADFFIKRPILSICLSVIIVLLGAFSILRLPISEYPDIIPPSIQVTATYPGADCETVVKSIASPIEQQMSGVDGMSYMTSVNTNNGQMSMMILFEIGTEANMDQVLSYLRYGQATSQLPSEVSALGVSLRKTSGLPALVVSLYSPQGTYDGLWLANYAYINMVDAIKRVPGVGDVQVFGAGRYAMRIWLNPEKMAALNITARDVMLAVQAQNAVNPAGKIGAQPAPPDQQLSFTVKAPGRLTSVKEFENIVVRGQDSSIVRVGDIARVELGSETYSLSSSVNGMPAASIGIYEAPGGNAIQLVDNIKALLKNTDMPPGMDYLVSLDSTLAVRAGIEDIVSTLVIALGLVVLVVSGLCRSGVYRGRFHRLSIVRLFHQYHLPDGAGAGHRPGRGRCHCGGGSGEEPYFQRRKAPPGHHCGHEGSIRPHRQHGAGDFLRLYPHAAAARRHRQTV